MIIIDSRNAYDKTVYAYWYFIAGILGQEKVAHFIPSDAMYLRLWLEEEIR
jgi:hypothetical protein